MQAGAIHTHAQFRSHGPQRKRVCGCMARAKPSVALGPLQRGVCRRPRVLLQLQLQHHHHQRHGLSNSSSSISRGILQQGRRHRSQFAPLPTASSSSSGWDAGSSSSSSNGSSSSSSMVQLMEAWSQLADKLSPVSPTSTAAATDLILSALKLAVSCLQAAPARADGRTPLQRALDLAARLAELCAAGVPFDAHCIAAGVLAEAVDLRLCSVPLLEARLGPGVAALAHDILAVRHAPARLAVLDDSSCSALRDWVLSAFDPRATAVEVVWRWAATPGLPALPVYQQQLVALEAVLVYGPLGHALGLGPAAAQLEDAAFKLVFPSSYCATADWLERLSAAASSALERASTQLQAAAAADPAFTSLAAGVSLLGRTKSTFSTMKKLLRLERLGAGGRRREQVYDLLGLRALVAPREDLPPAEAEAAATAACYRLRELAQQLWPPLPSRDKDYIAAPKANGYQSLHSTLTLPPALWAPQQQEQQQQEQQQQQQQQQQAPYHHAQHEAAAQSSSNSSSSGGLEPPEALTVHLELQVRTQAMHAAAERGAAAHAGYKGGLEGRQVRALAGWTAAWRARRQLLEAQAAAGVQSGGNPGHQLDQQQQQEEGLEQQQQQRRQLPAAGASSHADVVVPIGPADVAVVAASVSAAYAALGAPSAATLSSSSGVGVTVPSQSDAAAVVAGGSTHPGALGAAGTAGVASAAALGVESAPGTTSSSSSSAVLQEEVLLSLSMDTPLTPHRSPGPTPSGSASSSQEEEEGGSAAPLSSMSTQQLLAAATALFTHLDLDGDGSLSLSELAALFEELQGPSSPAQQQQQQQQLASSMSVGLDDTASSSSSGRFWWPLVGQDQPVSAAGEWLGLLDADRDGLVSLGEFLAYWQAAAAAAGGATTADISPAFTSSSSTTTTTGSSDSVPRASSVAVVHASAPAPSSSSSSGGSSSSSRAAAHSSPSGGVMWAAHRALGRWRLGPGAGQRRRGVGSASSSACSAAQPRDSSWGRLGPGMAPGAQRVGGWSGGPSARVACAAARGQVSVSAASESSSSSEVDLLPDSPAQEGQGGQQPQQQQQEGPGDTAYWAQASPSPNGNSSGNSSSGYQIQGLVDVQHPTQPALQDDQPQPQQQQQQRRQRAPRPQQLPAPPPLPQPRAQRPQPSAASSRADSPSGASTPPAGSLRALSIPLLRPPAAVEGSSQQQQAGAEHAAAGPGPSTSTSSSSSAYPQLSPQVLNGWPLMDLRGMPAYQLTPIGQTCALDRGGEVLTAIPVPRLGPLVVTNAPQVVRGADVVLDHRSATFERLTLRLELAPPPAEHSSEEGLEQQEAGAGGQEPAVLPLSHQNGTSAAAAAAADALDHAQHQQAGSNHAVASSSSSSGGGGGASGSVTWRTPQLQLRNLSRFVRGRYSSARVMVNGKAVLPHGPGVTVQPGDVIWLPVLGAGFTVSTAGSSQQLGQQQHQQPQQQQQEHEQGEATPSITAAAAVPTVVGDPLAAAWQALVLPWQQQQEAGGGREGSVATAAAQLLAALQQQQAARAAGPGAAGGSSRWRPFSSREDDSSSDEEAGDEDAPSSSSAAAKEGAGTWLSSGDPDIDALDSLLQGLVLSRALREAPDVAEGVLAALAARHPAFPAAWFMAAQLAAARGRASAARDLFRAAAATAQQLLLVYEAVHGPAATCLDPASPALLMSSRLVQVLRAWAAMEWGQRLYGSARRLWRLAANAAFRFPRQLAARQGGGVLHAWGLAELELDNVRNARVVVSEGTRKCPEDDALLLLAGSIEARAGAVSAARALYLRSYQINRSNKHLYYAWPPVEAAAGNVARARSLLSRGLSLFPYNTKIMNVSAHIEEQAGNVEGARALHRRALNVDSSSLTTMHNRVSWADLELRAGQVATARALLQEGLDRHPNFPAALALMARLERGQGALDLAEAYARRAQKVSHAFAVLSMVELYEVYKARGERLMAANLHRHLNAMRQRQAAKRRGMWGSDAAEEYGRRINRDWEVELSQAARGRKVELGLIRVNPDQQPTRQQQEARRQQAAKQQRRQTRKEERRRTAGQEPSSSASTAGR